MEICRVFRLASVFGQKCARLRPNRFVAFVNFNQKWICTDKSIRIESNQNKTIYWIDEKRREGKRMKGNIGNLIKTNDWTSKGINKLHSVLGHF